MKRLLFVLLVFLGIVSFANDFKVKNDLIVGVFDFKAAVLPQAVAESADKLRISDTHFRSITVAETHKDTYGIYFVYQSNDKVKTPDKLVEVVKLLLKNQEKNMDGHHISNSTIVIK